MRNRLLKSHAQTHLKLQKRDAKLQNSADCVFIVHSNRIALSRQISLEKTNALLKGKVSAAWNKIKRFSECLEST